MISRNSLRLSPCSYALSSWWTRLGPIAVAVSTACAPTAPAARAPATTSVSEAFSGPGTVTSRAVRTPTEPDLMAWDPGSRANLSRLREHGVVVVRYEAEGDHVDLELLSNCIADGTYTYSSYASSDTKMARTSEELQAQLPLGAARLSGKLAGNRALRTDYMLVGMLALPPDSAFASSQLRGSDCRRATHVISRIYLGGFGIVAGDASRLEAMGTVFGVAAGVDQSAEGEHLAREGNPAECAKALETGKAQPLCNVPLRVGLLAIERGDARRGPTPALGPSRGPRMIRIAAGVFMMGSNDSETEGPVHQVHLPSYEIDETEVTVAEYRDCVAAGACRPAYSDGSWLGGNHPNACNGDAQGRDLFPINCVDFAQASAFCAWANKRLPTEEEWEYAARGTDGRLYPWGNPEPTHTMANGAGGDRWAETAPAGSFPAGRSPFGLLDMAGNVAEWTSSIYCGPVEVSLGRECTNRVLRGGDWASGPVLLRATYRILAGPMAHFASIGFRCAR
jgi:formylglycine-generating enzyme required for sulfatase activity